MYQYLTAVADLDEPTAVRYWYILVAQSVTKVQSQIQKEIHRTELPKFFTEYCAKEHRRTRGVAYLNCCLQYDADGENISFFSERKPSNNLYIGFNCNLHTVLDGVDPLLMAHIERIEGVMSRTFWCNLAGYKYGQAAQALAKRGLNINAITIYWGPGGVGLSLYTEHLAAVYGSKNHRFFDPNIFYVDDELRKVVEDAFFKY